MLVDSHCHLDRLKLDDYQGDLSIPLQQAREQGVERFLCVSTDMARLPSMLALLQGQQDIVASVGVHPLSDEVDSITEAALLEAAANPQVVAIGETGLDYYYKTDNAKTQQQSFITHLKVSANTGKPVIVHTRDAREDTLNIIAEHGDSRVGGVLHCFTESLEMAERAMAMNYYISFSGIISFNNAKELREVVKQIPLEKMLIETDSPYLTPAPFRGKPNEPKYVKRVAECVAEIKGVSCEEVIETTGNNFLQLFNLS